MRSLRNVVSSSESSPVGLNLSEGETSGPWRQPAYTHETGEVVLAEATGKRQHVWDLWDVWKQHRIPSSVSRLNRQIGGWLRAHSVLLPGATLGRISNPPPTVGYCRASRRPMDPVLVGGTDLYAG
jgi:hypothetical protein